MARREAFTLPDAAWKLEGPWLVAALVAGGFLVAQGILKQPFIMAGLLVLGLFLVSIWHVRSRALPRAFLISLAVLLAGYAVIGRGFAHLGAPPFFYVGEIVLLLGVLAIVLGGGIQPAFRSPILWTLIVFMGWCALQTVPYLEEYGLPTLRDAATWGYGVFAFLVTGFLLRRGHLKEVLVFYRRIAPFVIVMIPILIINSRFGHFRVDVPGTGINLLNTRPGAMSVQLAGVGVFLALGLHQLFQHRKTAWSRARDYVLLGAWLMVALMTAVLNRGGMLSIGMAILTVLIIRPSRRWVRMAAIVMAVFGILLLADVRLEVESGREYSPAQLVENFTSIFGGEAEGNMSQTREWRLQWWSKILDYTVFGPHFWTGKGFGINLAWSDGIREATDEEGYPLRSPHNSHLTILARTGVPGFLLWVTFLSVFGISMLRGYWRARSIGLDWLARVNLWVIGFWVAFLVNMSFTVYLEGPHGGIWFWSLVGFGIALLQWQDSFTKTRPVAAQDTPAPLGRTEWYTSSKRP